MVDVRFALPLQDNRNKMRATRQHLRSLPRTSHCRDEPTTLCTHIRSRTIARNRLERQQSSCINWARSRE